MFTPNYATESGVFNTVRWERFPLAVWIDASSVQDADEMSDLRAGLSEWSDATGGVLGVQFVEKGEDADIMVKLVDRIQGANGRTRFAWTDHGFARLATIEVVHAQWSRGNVGIKSRTVQRDAAHEMGHALGIMRHTTKPGTIMLPDAAVDNPSPLDVNTIKAKYCELF
jgi:predicted Zn-dependent protease